MGILISNLWKEDMVTIGGEIKAISSWIGTIIFKAKDLIKKEGIFRCKDQEESHIMIISIKTVIKLFRCKCSLYKEMGLKGGRISSKKSSFKEIISSKGVKISFKWIRETSKIKIMEITCSKIWTGQWIRDNKNKGSLIIETKRCSKVNGERK